MLLFPSDFGRDADCNDTLGMREAHSSEFGLSVLFVLVLRWSRIADLPLKSAEIGSALCQGLLRNSVLSCGMNPHPAPCCLLIPQLSLCLRFAFQQLCPLGQKLFSAALCAL